MQALVAVSVVECVPCRHAALLLARPRALLFPTLIAATVNCASNRAVIQEELSCDLLVSFIKQQQAAAAASVSNGAVTSTRWTDDHAAAVFESHFVCVLLSYPQMLSSNKTSLRLRIASPRADSMLRSRS